MEKIFFDSWEGLLRTFIITLLAYISLILILRISGKRTLSKMNAFDFIVTIALGSVLASLMLSKSVALAEGILAMLLLVGLQFIVTFMAVRSKKFSTFIKATPTLLLYDGVFLEQGMRKERINEDEIYAVLRDNGIGKLEEAKAVILETDGSLSVIKNDTSAPNSTLNNVRRIS